LKRRVQIIGHRGSAATHPENSIAAFQQAIRCGADGLELDVWPNDGELLVTHDPVFSDALPTLDDVLRLPAPEDFWFDVEVKAEAGITPDAEAYARLLSEVIRRSPNFGSGRGRVMVRSFDHEILRAVFAIEPEIRLSALIEGESDDWVAIARSAQACGISPNYTTVTEDRVARAHAAGIGVSVWTVNDPVEWDRLAAIGVDAVITDDPAAAVRHWARRHAEG
jgi:glycerophosphoryl diester phosphodiesterase